MATSMAKSSFRVSIWMALSCLQTLPGKRYIGNASMPSAIEWFTEIAYDQGKSQDGLTAKPWHFYEHTTLSEG
jgi:hypothetical protein